MYLPLAVSDPNSPIKGVPGTLVSSLESFITTEEDEGRMHPEGRKLLDYFQKLGGAAAVDPKLPKGGLKKSQRKYVGNFAVNTDFDMYSVGRNGKSNAPIHSAVSRDDVLRGKNGMFFGLASTLSEQL